MSNDLTKPTFTADVSLDAGDMVEFNASGNVIAATADTTEFAGVAITDVTSGNVVALYQDEVVNLTAGDAIVPGNALKVAADQKVVPITAALDPYDAVIGVAQSAAATDGDEVSVKLKR
jgi:predicted RecA/RadA family phage recombinase